MLPVDPLLLQQDTPLKLCGVLLLQASRHSSGLLRRAPLRLPPEQVKVPPAEVATAWLQQPPQQPLSHLQCPHVPI